MALAHFQQAPKAGSESSIWIDRSTQQFDSEAVIEVNKKSGL